MAFTNALTEAAPPAAILSLWAGQGVRAVRHGKAADLFRRFRDEARDEIRALSDRMAGP